MENEVGDPARSFHGQMMGTDPQQHLTANLAEMDVQGLPATRVRVAGSVRPFRRVREIVHDAFCLDVSGGRPECALALIRSQVSIHVCDELYLIG